MFKHITARNLIFFIALSLTVLIAFGTIPRPMAFLVFALYGGYMVAAPTKKGLGLFVRSIPFFIALPFTTSFDNFNMWRLLLFMLFLKWLVEEGRWRLWFNAALGQPVKAGRLWFKKNKLEGLGLIVLFIMGLSVLVGQGAQLEVGAGFASVKRFIFVLNAVFLFVIIRDLIRRDKNNMHELAKDFAYSGLLAVFFGYVQFIAAYLQPAWVFHYWWGQVVSLNMYGAQWADIATNFGNTWFSYSGDTLRLRMFSTFPDSHSFPMYVLMTIPAMFVVLQEKIKDIFFAGGQVINANKKRVLLFTARALKHWPHVLVLSIIYLALIFSGTRGIWLASLSALFVAAYFKARRMPSVFITAILLLLVLFLAMFPAYFAVVSFPQFQDTGFSSDASLNRIRSIIDFGETSNSGRIYIWKETIKSITEFPLLGVGIGNYPMVLTEPTSSLRAGASAHNLYLHLASTIGIPGLVVFLWFLWEFAQKSISYIKANTNTIEALYLVLVIFSLGWVFAYLMTDAALYDGRALLGFMVIMGMSAGLLRYKEQQ